MNSRDGSEGTIAVAHRAELLEMLGGHVDRGRVRLAHRCVAVSQDSNGVTARFENGETVRADALIGADGLRSIVRRQLFGTRRSDMPGIPRGARS